MTLRQQGNSRVWSGAWSAKLAWINEIAAQAMRGVRPLIANRIGVAISDKREFHNPAAKSGASAGPLHAPLPQITRSPNGPSACPLCCSRQ